MFFQKNHNITIFMLILALMLWANVGMAQTEWEKYPGNPVLDLGASGTWEDTNVHSAIVLFDGTEYQMWYTGDNGSNRKIGYATSTDGIGWEKHPANPVLDLGANGTWDDNWVFEPTVLFDGTKYQMWYIGNDGSNHRIGYATSTDGIGWEKHSNNPVLDLGVSGAWDDYHVSSPTVLFDGTKYHIWYSGYDGSNWRIGYATSADGIVWEKYPGNPVLDLGESGTWDDSYVNTPTVLFDGTKYQMWYTGINGTARIGYATSANGIMWEKHPDNPVLDIGENGTWDDSSIFCPTVLFDGAKYQMWYHGSDGSNMRIGYATSIPNPGSINGTVTDMVGNPIERALVIARKKLIKKGTLTDSKGYYEITCLEPGTYLVIAIKKGYKAGFAKVTVESDKTTTQDFKLGPKSGKDDEDDFADLFANYPNPFNPDTWIPYYLPKDAEVTIQIYNSAGQLVRTINLGRKAAGVYLNKDQAAYWDGRDSLGEKVASGIYFYTLRAGDFTATRKMIVMK